VRWDRDEPGLATHAVGPGWLVAKHRQLAGDVEYERVRDGLRQSRRPDEREQIAKGHQISEGATRVTEDSSPILENDSDEAVDNVIDGPAKSVGPLRALRRHCLWCCGGSANEVKLCPAKACPLWTFRLGHRPTPESKAAVADVKLYPLERPSTGGEFHSKRSSVLKAIRRRCTDCSGGSQVAANACTVTDCDLHPFRKGKNPNRAYSKERGVGLAEALAVRLGRKRG
jgi:hypothetical protein